MAFYRCSAEKEPETRIWDTDIHSFIDKQYSLIITAKGDHDIQTDFRGGLIFSSFGIDQGSHAAETYFSPWLSAQTLRSQPYLTLGGCYYCRSYFNELSVYMGYDPVIIFSEVFYDPEYKCVREIELSRYHLNEINTDSLKIPFVSQVIGNQVYATTVNYLCPLLYVKVKLLNGINIFLSDPPETIKVPKVVNALSNIFTNVNIYTTGN